MFFTKTRMKFLSIFAGIFIIAAMMPASSLSFADENSAARIDGVSYATLQAAFDAAGSGKTVVLQKNILDERTVSETGNDDARGLVLRGKKAITLNMNGKSIKEDELAAALSVESGSSLTIDGSGEIENTSNGGTALSGEPESVKESNSSIITFTIGQSLFKAAKIKVYKVTADAGEGGAVTRVANVGGGSAAYKVTSDDGYCIKKITVNGIEQPLTNEYSQTVEIKNVQSDQYISAEFMAKTYEIKSSVKTSPSKYVGGAITKTAYVKHNQDRTFKVSPRRGFTVKAVYVDGENVGAVTAYTFKNVNKSHEIRAEFKKGLFIMLDAGHYGKYNRYVGTYDGSYYYESQMSWKLHKYLKKELEKFQGIKADKTRPVQKKDLPVYERGKKAKGYDLFLSLHSNSSISESADYPLVIRQHGASNKQIKLANKLCETIRDTMNCKDAGQVWARTYKWKGKTYDWYGVLRGSAAVKTNGYILEHSFHTNKAKARWLYNNDNLKKMAKNEAKIIAEHYGLTTPVSEANTDAVITDDTPEVDTSGKYKVMVNTAALNVREKASVSSKKKGVIKKNAVYTINRKSSNGKWGKLSCRNGGWINLSYTKKVSSKKAIKAYKMRSAVSNLNLHAGPGVSYKKIGKITSKTKKYTIVDENKSGTWGKLKGANKWLKLSSVNRIY